MTPDAPTDGPAARLPLTATDEAAAPASELDPAVDAGTSEDPAAEPQSFSAAEEAAAIQAEPASPFNRAAIAARAFQVYSDHVTATARSMHETPSEELHRRHDQAAKARHGLNTGHKVR